MSTSRSRRRTSSTTRAGRTSWSMRSRARRLGPSGSPVRSIEGGGAPDASGHVAAIVAREPAIDGGGSRRVRLRTKTAVFLDETDYSSLDKKVSLRGPLPSEHLASFKKGAGKKKKQLDS